MSDYQTTSWANRLQESWYGITKPLWVLLPLAWLFSVVTTIRRRCYEYGWFSVWKAPVPVIVVGNISVGGSGKTPVVIALVEALKKAGYKPGVVSRGYGGHSEVYPLSVNKNTQASVAGDEPVLIARRCEVPLVVGPDRVAAVKKLLAENDCNVVISDDGLQHYALQRDVEIVVIDAARGLGNGHLLPLGPLRESVQRLESVAAIVFNGSPELSDKKILPIALRHKASHFALHPDRFIQLTTGVSSPSLPPYKKLAALAGIGHPQRFFNALESQGLIFSSHPFVDHHVYSSNDFATIDADLLVMTEKDAVKCIAFNDSRIWYQPVSAQFSESFLPLILTHLNQFQLSN